MVPERARSAGGKAQPDAAPADVSPHDQRARYQREFEFALDAQVVTDSFGVILEANHAAAGLLNCPKEFLGGKPLGLFAAEGDRSHFYGTLVRLATGVSSDSFEARIGRAGTQSRLVFVIASATDGSGGFHAEGTYRWVLRDVTAQRRAEVGRDDLLRKLVTAQEDERRRVSRELHDSVGQLLTALALAVRSAGEANGLSADARTRLAEVQQVADELSRTVHDLAVRLRPTMLDDIGLHAVLTQHIAGWSAQTGIEVDFEAGAVEAERLPPDVETVVYRVVQEALTNVARHARARRVSVVVTRHEGSATVAVEDDGVGFDPEAVADARRLGLLGMRERVALAGGELDVESNPGWGTTVLARLPLTGAGVGEQKGNGRPESAWP